MAVDNIRCVVERIIYQNETTGYSVIKCRAKGYKELVTLSGFMPDIYVGGVISASGSWVKNTPYGRNFIVQNCLQPYMALRNT